MRLTDAKTMQVVASREKGFFQDSVFRSTVFLDKIAGILEILRLGSSKVSVPGVLEGNHNGAGLCVWGVVFPSQVEVRDVVGFSL